MIIEVERFSNTIDIEVMQDRDIELGRRSIALVLSGSNSLAALSVVMKLNEEQTEHSLTFSHAHVLHK